MAIVTLAEAKAHLNIAPDQTGDDIELQVYVDAATAAIEKELGRVVDRRTIVDQCDFAAGVRQFLVRSVPVISLTSIVSLDGTLSWSVGPSVMRVDGPSGLVTVLSGPPVSGSVLVAYEAGETAAPANERLAAKIIIQHLWETQRGVMGIQLGGDNEPFTPGRGFAIPRRAQELLANQLPGIA